MTPRRRPDPSAYGEGGPGLRFGVPGNPSSTARFLHRVSPRDQSRMRRAAAVLHVPKGRWVMAESQRVTAVAVFPDRTHAEVALEELRASGFPPEQIGFLVPDGSAGVEVPPLDPGNKAEEGAGVGAAAGGLLGGIVGAALATAVIPGVGPVIAGGLLLGALGGVAVGATGGGILGGLVGLNIPEEEARHHAREFHSGRTLITVQAGDRYEEAVAILGRAAEKPEGGTHGRTDRSRLAGGDQAPGAGSAFVPRP